ncbi:Gfo/Idh/MocA family protein [Vallicoccus soli]|uniref:Gfo/Idh/MocA family oxidoreductase n=1 Tax=Vallicoccus soli TaxID=2339232 RepID=A0A3A3YZM1_9ACTN|nr:Gfo/Idh/MocA family oxidoreductase [Vallicoccus soli]RJK96333.1 gfo/Idh/MocA family oxidoreductase [Vallicoccus soli]
MTRPVGWAVVGGGWVARDHFAPALAASAGDRAVVVCDVDPAAARRTAAALPGARWTTDVDDAVTDAAVQAVYVATPNHAHRAPVVAAARAGRAVLCEKPLAATLGDAAAIVAACDGVLAGSAFDQRWHPAHTALAALVRAGALGPVTAVRIAYGCWLPPSWTPPGATVPDNWRADPLRAGGGAYVDLAPHGLDLVGALLGEDVERATAVLQRRVHDYAVDDGAVLVGTTGGGALVSLHVSYNTRDALPRRRLEVVGTRAQAVAVDTMGQTAGGALTLLDGATGAAQPVAFDTARSPFAAQLAAFSAAVAGERAWPYPLERDLALLTLLHDAAGLVPPGEHPLEALEEPA